MNCHRWREAWSARLSERSTPSPAAWTASLCAPHFFPGRLGERPPDGMRIAVIGDVGGHANPLRHELARLGAHPDGSLPEDLIVVQVGDLIHRGPDSAQVVDMIDGYLRTQPAQWIQLIGNHEAHYLQAPVFAWPETLSRKHIRILNRWWQNGTAVVATAVET